MERNGTERNGKTEGKGMGDHFLKSVYILSRKSFEVVLRSSKKCYHVEEYILTSYVFIVLWC